MASVVVSLRIMPNNVDIDLEKLQVLVKKEIIMFCNSQEFRTTIQPVAFGLKSLNIIFVMDENKGSTEELENKISGLEGVESVEVTDVRRAIG